eukprot:COSAG02_NODE_952_length_15692_cov_7.587764_2_plen_69_part_00
MFIRLPPTHDSSASSPPRQHPTSPLHYNLAVQLGPLQLPVLQCSQAVLNHLVLRLELAVRLVEIARRR